ncbi:Fic family protein [Mariprofundus ferrinatatus]|uniref:Fic family protein n=2 Tax=Mariprofundus ferrinatatus TaxID=1921087 RepID=A0A2K8L4C9_9PROT|nr:Fic family protein [Mariprofundus ferrinatatus]
MPKEEAFLLEEGKLLGALKHFSDSEKSELTVELISNEALKSSEIEGEYLNRESLQSSIRKNFGLSTNKQAPSPPAEQGMAEMMIALYCDYDCPLTHEEIFSWHAKLMMGRRDIHDVGIYRTGEDPMQVISGSIHKPKVHFEAPPSSELREEMEGYIQWFNDSSPNGKHPLPALTRSGLAHLYFVTIHPFEDGNGRIGRALSEKALSQALKQPSLIALSQIIERQKKEYYAQLNKHNHTLHVTSWLSYFAETILEANRYSQNLIEFLINKAKLYDRIHGQINERQGMVLARMFKEGPEGFTGGLSAENYIKIAKTSRATATRDLQKLLELGALFRTGTLKGTRYWLKLSE